MSDVRMRFIPGGKRILELPVPFISRSDKIGEIHFDPEADVPEDVAEILERDFGATFERVNVTSVKAKQPPREFEVKKYQSKGIATIQAKRMGGHVEQNPLTDEWEVHPGAPVTQDAEDAKSVPRA